MIPEMRPVTSSNIDAIGHDGTALFVRFKTKDGTPGAIYRYPEATRAHHDAMLSADSPGRYFFGNIRHLKAEKL